MRTKSSIRVACALLCVVASAAGCGKGASSDSELRANLGLDLAKVAGFVLTKSAAPASGASRYAQDAPVQEGTVNQLYALDEDGSLTIVTVTEGGSSSTTEQPFAVFSTPLYVMIAYHGVTHGSAQCNFVAARRSDGALYCVTAPNTSFADYGPRSATYGPLIQTDAGGTLIWINHDSGVSLLNFTNPDAATQTTPAGSDAGGPNGPLDGPFNMAVNAAGDGLVADINGKPKYTRVFFPSGGFFGVSDTFNSCLVSGPPSSPDDFYYTSSNSNELVKLTKTGPASFTKSTVASIDLTDCPAGRVRAGEHVFFTSSSSNALYDLAGDALTSIAMDPLAKIQQIGACSASLFALGPDENGNGGIVRYDLGPQALTVLVVPGAYALTTMAVSPGCEVTFYGQRASDGAYILGTIPAGSNDVRVDATGFPPVTQIERLN